MIVSLKDQVSPAAGTSPAPTGENASNDGIPSSDPDLFRFLDPDLVNQRIHAWLDNPAQPPDGSVPRGFSRSLDFFREPVPHAPPQQPDYCTGSSSITADALNDRYLYDLKKTAGVPRIVTLGDSFTGGACVDVGDSWPEQLEDAFGAKGPKRGAEVINLGFGGYDVQYGSERYRKRGAKYEPDLIIWLLRSDNLVLVNDILQLKIHETAERLINHSAVSRHDSRRQAIREALEELTSEQGREAAMAFNRKVLQEFGTGYHGDLLIVTIDNDVMTDSKTRELLRAFANQRPRTYYHEVPDIYEDRDNSFHAEYGDRHPTARGHGVIARSIMARLKKESLPGERSAASGPERDDATIHIGEQFGSLLDPSALPLLIAIHNGYFSDAGLKIKMTPLKTYAAASNDQYADYFSDYDCLLITHKSYYRLKKTHQRDISVFSASFEGRSFPLSAVLVRKDSEIRTANDLRGRTIGILRNSGDSHPYLSYKVPGLMEVGYEEYRDRRVDAIVVKEPELSLFLSNGVDRIIVREPISDWVMDPWLVTMAALSPRFVMKSPDKAKKFIRCWYRALDEIKANPEETSALYQSLALRASGRAVVPALPGFWKENEIDFEALEKQSGLHDVAPPDRLKSR